MARTPSATPKDSTANLGFEAKLWLAADKLRNNMDAAEYKHVVLGLIFLKYISDTFEEHRAKLLAGEGDYAGANPEDPDEYKAENVFWVPADARWAHLQASAKQPTIGKTVDDAMVAIERDNPRLKGVLPKDYARPGLDKHRLGELIDLIATITLTATSEGEKTHRSVDLLGRVYENFLTCFASAEGKNGGQFYTPSCVVRLLVEMLAPYKGRIYDPCCGWAGMFVQSEKFVEAHGHGCKLGDISIYGQESNSNTRRRAVMNLALRGIEADFRLEHAETFRHDHHHDLRADTATRVSAIPQWRSHLADLLRSERQLLANRPSTTPTGFARTTTRAGSSASRRRTTPSSPRCSTSSTVLRRPHPDHSEAWPASSPPMAACPRTSSANAVRKAQFQSRRSNCMALEVDATSAAASSRPTSWTACSPIVRASVAKRSLD